MSRLTPDFTSREETSDYEETTGPGVPTPSEQMEPSEKPEEYDTEVSSYDGNENDADFDAYHALMGRQQHDDL